MRRRRHGLREARGLGDAAAGAEGDVGEESGVDGVEDDEEGEREHCTSTVLFRGHKSAVSALAFTDDGTVLVSGGRDTDVVVWDALEEKGLFRLNGLRGQVTSMVFVKHVTDGGKGKKAKKKSKKIKSSNKNPECGENQET